MFLKWDVDGINIYYSMLICALQPLSDRERFRPRGLCFPDPDSLLAD